MRQGSVDETLNPENEQRQFKLLFEWLSGLKVMAGDLRKPQAGCRAASPYRVSRDTGGMERLIG
jgi:hypothetical protein